MSSDQPKPAGALPPFSKEYLANEHDAKHFGEPKPTGEWTAEWVKIHVAHPQWLAEAHNATLAESVHYWQGVATQEWHKGFTASHDEHQKQLAAEREKLRELQGPDAVGAKVK